VVNNARLIVKRRWGNQSQRRDDAKTKQLTDCNNHGQTKLILMGFYTYCLNQTREVGRINVFKAQFGNFRLKTRNLSFLN